MSDGIDKMMYVGEKPWHGFGTYVGDKEVTSAEAIKLAGLDWNVVLKPVFAVQASVKAPQEGNPTERAHYGIGDLVAVPKKRAVTREDTGQIFEILSDKWHPLQNRDAFSFFDALVREKAAIYHTAGALWGGRLVWILAKLPGYITIPGTEDKTEKYVLLANGHDGTMAVRLRTTPIRVVCANTLSMALSVKDVNEVRMNHSVSDYGEKVGWARTQLGLVNAWYADLEQAMTFLAHKKVPDAAAYTTYLDNIGVLPVVPTEGDAELIEKRVKVRRERSELMESLFEHGRGNDLPGVKGSWWGAYNSVVEFVDYRMGKTVTDQRRWERANFGDGDRIKSAAWTQASAMASV